HLVDTQVFLGSVVLGGIEPLGFEADRLTGPHGKICRQRDDGVGHGDLGSAAWLVLAGRVANTPCPMFQLLGISLADGTAAGSTGCLAGGAARLRVERGTRAAAGDLDGGLPVTLVATALEQLEILFFLQGQRALGSVDQFTVAQISVAVD